MHDVPPEHQRAAEQVRAHLVALRGGAPFLSSRDGQLLLRWLDEAVPVVDILCAIERAADRRAARRSRLPLTLGQASRHLGRRSEAQPCPPPHPERHPFAPVADRLRRTREDPRHEQLLGLADALVSLDQEGDELVTAGMSHITAFLQSCWEGLDEAEQVRRIASATEELGEVAQLVGEEEAQLLAEEAARGELRTRYPALSAATLWQLAHGSPA